MNSKQFIILIITAVYCVSAEDFKQDYTGHRLIRIEPKTSDQSNIIDKLAEHLDFDIWNRAKGMNETADVLLPPNTYDSYSNYLKKNNIQFSTLVDNIQDLFDEQDKMISQQERSSSVVGKFARYSEIDNYIDELTQQNPSIASSYVAGTTFEDRNLKVLVLKTTKSQRNIWIDCGIHAREWISPSTCIWIMNELVNGYKNGDSQVVSLLNYFEFHIMPLVNPDGYEYSFKSRMWRKNRRTFRSSSCVGVDLNRNWGYKWMTGGSSSYVCSDTYAGDVADSEPETRAIQAALRRTPNRWDAYITMHSYGLWWFTPFGYSKSARPANYNEQLAKAKLASDAFGKVHGSKMVEIGASAAILGVGSGGSEDWAYGALRIPYAFCLELRPSRYDSDRYYGFALPPDRIPYAGRETYAGIVAFLNSIQK